MKLCDLIERLEEYRSEMGDDAEVRLMTQQNWPFENTIIGLCSGQEINDACDTEEEPEHGDVEADDVIYLCEGTQLGYGTKRAWDAAW